MRERSAQSLLNVGFAPTEFFVSPADKTYLGKLLPGILPAGTKYDIDKLDAIFSVNLKWLVKRISSDTNYKAFTRKHGVPGMIALYDTRRQPWDHFDTTLAERFLKDHPQHYDASAQAAGLRRDVLPYAFTEFSDSYSVFKAATGNDVKFKLKDGVLRRLRILSPDVKNGRMLVRIASTRDKFGEEGWVRKSDLFVPKLKKFTDAPKKLRLVFVQNTERIGADLLSIKNGQTNRDTNIKLTTGKTAKLKKGAFVSLPDASQNTATEYYAKAFITNDYEPGHILKAHISDDIDRRTNQRKYMVNVAVNDGAKKKKSVFYDVIGGLCSTDHIPIEYSSGRQIANGIRGASNAAGKKVDEIYIVSHGSASGISGTGDLDHRFGIYLNYMESTLKANPTLSAGGLTSTQFVELIKDHVSTSVRIWLLGCKTANTDKISEPFAKQFGEELRRIVGGTSSVAGMKERGEARRGFTGGESFVIFPGGKIQNMPGGSG